MKHLIVIFFLTIYQLSFATTYFVSTSGLATNSGLSQSDTKNLSWAITNAIAGDLVYIQAGNYGGATYTQNNSGTVSNPIQFIGTNTAWNPIVANQGCTFVTGDDVDASVMPLLQEARVGMTGVGTAMKLNGDYVKFSNFQIKYYERGFENNGDYNTIDNIFTLEQGNHDQADKTDPFGGFYSGWGMIIRGLHPILTNCLNVDAGAQGITFTNTDYPQADYCYVSAYLGVDLGGNVWNGNPNDYYFLLGSSTTNGLFTNITANRATENKHYGHGIVFKGNSGTISNNVVDGFTIYNTNLELQFPVVQNNTCTNGYIETLTGIDANNIDAGGINLANGSSSNTFDKIEIVNRGIYFKDWADGLSGDVADASDNNDFNQIIIRDSYSAISFNWWQNGYTTSAADNNTFNNLTVDNCSYLFESNRANTGTIIKNSIIHNVTNLVNGPRGTSPGYPVNVSYDHCNFYNSFTTPGGTNITSVDPLFTNLTTDDFSLQSTSPLIGQGIVTSFLPAGNDIGAVQGSIPVTPSLITDDTIALCQVSPALDFIIDGTEENLWHNISSNDIIKTKAGVSAPSTSDLSANYKATWDQTSLFLFVTVMDDNLVYDGGVYIHDDGLSIYIDGGDENTSVYDVNDYSLGFNYSSSDIYQNNMLYAGTGIQKSESLITGGYIMEIKIDWNVIGITPNTANTVGFDIHVNDDDDGGNRDQKIIWNDATDSAYVDPSKLGSLVLSNDGCSNINASCYLSTPVTIDAIEETMWTQIDSTTIGSAVSGQALPSVSDLSGVFKTTWDSTSLYLLIKVKDDAIISDGGVYIHDDGLSIYIDAGNEDATSYDANDFNLGFRINTTDIISNSVLYTGNGISKAESLTTDGYLMEIKIDWSYLGIMPNTNNWIGIDVHVNDDDDGGNRDAKILWNDKTDQAYTNPSLLGELVLSNVSCGVFCAPTSSQLTITDCGSHTLNSQTYTSTGTYTQTTTNAAGCDSTITLNLTINQPTSSALTETSCGDFILNGQTYNSGGTFTQIINNSVGCDSTITLNLTIESFDLFVNNNPGQLSSNQANVAYQWFDCDAAVIISGETNQFYHPSTNGNYAVILQSSTCIDTTDCVFYSTSSINENFSIEHTVFPNPSNGQFKIELNKEYESVFVAIFDMQGAMITNQTASNKSKIEFKNNDLAHGLYILHIQIGQESVNTVLVVE